MTFNNDQKRWLGLVLFVATGSAFLIPGIIYYRKAFPESSIDFKISRTQAFERGEAFLRSRSIKLDGHLRSIEFDYDPEARVFLDREAADARSQKLIAGQIRLWRWKARWFKPHEKEEYRVFISPEGEISGYRRVLPEEAGGKSISMDEARRRAEDFLRDEARVRLEDYSLIEQEFTRLEQRTDRTFTWERSEFTLSDATHRIIVKVQGDEVGSFFHILNIPEEWRRNYRMMTARNDLLQNIAFFLAIPLLLAIPIVMLLRIRKRDVRWTIGIFLAMMLFVLYILQGINSIPMYLSGFDTTQSLGSFSGWLTIRVLVQALMYGIIIFILASGAEPLYRELFPQRLLIRKFFSLRFFRTEEFFSSAIAGYGLALFHIGYVVLFYLLGKKIGVWSPTEIGYTDALSTFIPWIYPLTASLTASLFEELIFRVFAISLLRRILPDWLAVVIPGILWGFLHSNYPQQPFFIRGIEVGILGIIAGFVFLRWGFFATLIWHYSVDAVFIGLFLFSSSNLYFIFSGIMVVGLLFFPMIISIISIVRYGFTRDESGLRNSDDLRSDAGTVSSSVQYQADERKFFYLPLSGGKIIFLLVAAIISLSVIILLQVSPPWGEPDIAIAPSQAERIAQAHLEKRGFDHSRFRRVVSFMNLTGSYEDRYIQNVQGWKGLEKAYEIFNNRYVWDVRFFLPMNQEEYNISLDERGDEVSFSHIIPEERRVPDTTVGEAQRRAESYLIEERGILPDEYSLVDVSQNKKLHRVDYTFVWKWKRERPGSGEYRISVSVTGDEVRSSSKYIKIPEEWKKLDEKEDLKDIAFFILRTIMIAAAAGFAIALFVRDFIWKRIEWKAVIVVPLLIVVFYAVRELNRLPTIFQSYGTSIPAPSFLLSLFMSHMLQAAGMFISALILYAAALSLYRDCHPGLSLFPRKDTISDHYFRDALLSAPCILLLALAGYRIFGWMDVLMDIPRTGITAALLPGMDTFLPFIDVISSSIIIAFFLTPVLYFGLFFYRRYLKKPLYFYLLSIPIVAVYISTEVKSIPELFFILAVVLCAVMAGFHLIKDLLHTNMAACFLSIILIISVPMVTVHLSLTSAYYRVNGMLGLVSIFAIGYAVCFMMKRGMGT